MGTGKVAVVALAAAVVAVLIVFPLTTLFVDGFTVAEGDARAMSAVHLLKVVGNENSWAALRNTLAISLAATLVSVVLGVCLGWLFGRTDITGARLLEQFATLPIFIPPFVGAIAWTLLAAPRIGLLNVAIAWMGVPLSLDVYTQTGMAWVIGIYLTPYVMMIVAGALRSMDPSLEEAARIAGFTASRATLFVTLPLILPAILSGATLSFAISIGLFGTPVVLGWSKQILLLTSRIWIASQAVPPQYGEMAILAMFLVILSVASSALQRRLMRKRTYITVTGKGYKPRPVRLGRAAAVAKAFVAGYLFLTVVAPIGVLAGATLSTYTWSGRFTTENVRSMLHSTDVWTTLANSVLLSVAAATVALALGFGIAWMSNRTKLPGRRLLEFVVLLPVSVPGIAFGVGVMLLWLRLPLDVYGTAWIIILAFVGRFTAYAVQPISAALVQVHPELEESARVAGYGWMRTFGRITVPLVRQSAVGSWVLLLSIFMTELSMVVLLYTADTRTFSILSFEVWNIGDFSMLSGLSLLQLLVGASIMLAVRGVFAQRGIVRGSAT
jgi:iron(III) transport system permease protein